MKLQVTALVALVLFGASLPHTSHAQSSTFTYQGRLDVSGNPASGVFDLQLHLMDSASGGSALGPAQTFEDVAITNGLFTLQINSDAAAFDGSDRWIELGVRPGASTGTFTTLTPRQQITSAPYAIRAANVDAAGVSGVIPGAGLSGDYGSPVTFDNTANVFNGTFFGNYYGLSFVGGSFSGAFIGNGSGLGFLNGSQILSGTIPSAALNNSWRTIGNAGTTPSSHFLGTTDNQPLELRVNNRRILRLEPNVNDSPNILGGSVSNSILAGVEGATIAGGGIGLYPNTITANYATIGGGTFHIVGGAWSTIAGGRDNIVLGNHSTIAGGWANHIWNSASYASIGGGVFNVISTNSNYSTVAGGYLNNIGVGSEGSTIGGGYGNNIGTNSLYSIVSGGSDNRIYANASYATVPGGAGNSATNLAFAAGRNAKAVHAGSFVWSDSQGFDFSSTATDEVSFRALGGVRFASGVGGANQTVSWMPGSASWSFTSDRNTKENLNDVNAEVVLEKVAGLPLHEWNYIGYPQRHIGPMAQDFHAAFPLNNSDTTLNSADLQGVTLAAIQGLNRKLTDELKRRDAENAELKQRLERVEKLLNDQR